MKLALSAILVVVLSAIGLNALADTVRTAISQKTEVANPGERPSGNYDTHSKR